MLGSHSFVEGVQQEAISRALAASAYQQDSWQNCLASSSHFNIQFDACRPILDFPFPAHDMGGVALQA
ncbi:hypothetical protein WJX84_005138 [Apatococcus fuscideae]|uniref:Uncharacterized protein n=1 Tax=Apatococcus fuscideae TaxID=2026836 RepID=A0AAW1RUI3_9CHLO